MAIGQDERVQLPDAIALQAAVNFLVRMPCLARRSTYAGVLWLLRMRTIAMAYKALLAARSPPRFGRCRTVLPVWRLFIKFPLPLG